MKYPEAVTVKLTTKMKRDLEATLAKLNEKKGTVLRALIEGYIAYHKEEGKEKDE